MLVMACVSAGMWMRSQNHLDHLSLNLDDEFIHAINSTPHGIGWMKQRSPGVQWFTGRVQFSAYMITPEKYARMFESIGTTWSLCGFRRGIGKRVVIWVIPYWSLVLPLTLLSAWLIIGKRSAPVDRTQRVAPVDCPQSTGVTK